MATATDILDTPPSPLQRSKLERRPAGHIAGRTRGVHPPGTADVVSPLDHDKVGLPVLLKRDRGAEPGALWIRVHLPAVSVFADSWVAETPAAVEFSM